MQLSEQKDSEFVLGALSEWHHSVSLSIDYRYLVNLLLRKQPDMTDK